MRYFIAIGYILFLTACTNIEHTTNSSSGANPATLKCIDDGYELKAVEQNGIVIRYLCVNLENGKKCTSWSYYREECYLK